VISKGYAARQSHVDFDKSLILIGNIGSDRKVPAVVLEPIPFTLGILAVESA
jgi:hypothetical protein